MASTTLAPTVTALSLLSMDPSPAVVQSARSAAGTRHGLVNVTRLVRSLDKQRLEHVRQEADGSNWLEVQKTWETVLYARALLYALQGANEQASTTASALGDLDAALSKIEVHVQATAKNTRAPAPITSLPLIDLPRAAAPSPAVLLDEAVPASLSLDSDEAVLAVELPTSPLPTVPAPSISPRLAPVLPSSTSHFNTSTYFAKRSREDAAGGEAGLLPLKVAKKSNNDPMDQEGMRQRLMGGAQGAIGSSQLHEELGGQLVDMSRQLKLNSVHFSNSMEQEKALLQSSQDVLEKNLASTKASKGHLSTVSSKGRSTTCMTLGVVILVLVLFIWTYMLIRFT